jgi:hypothetical protein
MITLTSDSAIAVNLPPHGVRALIDDVQHSIECLRIQLSNLVEEMAPVLLSGDAMVGGELRPTEPAPLRAPLCDRLAGLAAQVNDVTYDIEQVRQRFMI